MVCQYECYVVSDKETVITIIKESGIDVKFSKEESDVLSKCYKNQPVVRSLGRGSFNPKNVPSETVPNYFETYNLVMEQRWLRYFITAINNKFRSDKKRIYNTSYKDDYSVKYPNICVWYWPEEIKELVEKFDTYVKELSKYVRDPLKCAFVTQFLRMVITRVTELHKIECSLKLVNNPNYVDKSIETSSSTDNVTSEGTEANKSDNVEVINITSDKDTNSKNSANTESNKKRKRQYEDINPSSTTERIMNIEVSVDVARKNKKQKQLINIFFDKIEQLYGGNNYNRTNNKKLVNSKSKIQ